MGGEFLARQYALYLAEHRHPGNRATHFVGIPIIVLSVPVAWALGSWLLLGIAQALGWFLQLLGHRLEGNRPAFLRNPASFLMGPLMVGVEMAGFFGVRPAFARRAREPLGPQPVSPD